MERVPALLLLVVIGCGSTEDSGYGDSDAGMLTKKPLSVAFGHRILAVISGR